MFGALPPVFAGLEQSDSQEAAAHLQELQLEAGELLMEQGEEDLTLAFVVKGSVSLLDGDVRIGGIGARDMLGEMELFGHMARVASAECSSPVALQILAHDSYVALCEAGNRAVFNLERHAHRKQSDRLRWLNEGIADRTAGRSFELKRKGLFARLSNAIKGRSIPPTHPAEVLQQSPMFGWADSESLGEIAAAFEVERFGADEIICRQGEPGDKMYVIAEGHVDVMLLMGESHAETISELGPGRAFGDSSLVQHTPRIASCVSRDEVLALSLDRVRYGELFAADDPTGSVFRQAMLRNLIGQVIDAQKRFVSLDRQATARSEETLRGTPVSTVWRD
jgi:CRP-like cAMP-binding protein